MPTATPIRTPTATPELRKMRTIPDIICDGYAWPCEQAIAVARCESGLNPNAVNRSSNATGLFQIIPYWHAWRLRPGESLLDPEVNTRIAFELWSESGWSAWECNP